MGCGEGRVKRLDAEHRRVFVEASAAHQRDGAESTDVAVVEVPAIVQLEAQRGVRSLVLGQWPATEEKRTGEAGLHHDAIAGVELQHDQLGAAPRSHETAAHGTSAEVGCRTLAEHVRSDDADLGDAATGDLAIEVPGDRLSLWELRHRNAASDA